MVVNSKLCFSELGSPEAWEALDYANTLDLSLDSVKDNVERIFINEVSLEDFVERFEKPYKPVVILGVQNTWRAKEKWATKVTKNY